MKPIALVVEDEPGLRALYDHTLKRAGYTTHLAPNGRAAIELLGGLQPALVVLDIHLPDVKGTEVLEYIASQPLLHGAHVIIASASHEYEQLVGLVPSAEFLLKPVLPKQILTIAERVQASITANSA